MQVAEQTLHVGEDPDAVPHARRWVAETLRQTAFAALVPDAELAVSELVTNALLHALPPVAVRVVIEDTYVRIEVADGSRVAPVRPLARADAMTGRGLALVSALSRDWGFEARRGGKIVWCELSPDTPDDEPDTDVDALLAAWDDNWDDPDAEPRFTVSLGDVPTDLLLSAKAHVDNIVREFTLAAQGAESGRTAALPAQLAELVDTVVTRFTEPRQMIKRQALDAATRGLERTTLTLTVPLSAADAGEQYLAALDEVDTYARAARLLTLETPPQHRIFRRWYVESLVAQLRAAAAGRPIRPGPTLERRLLQEIAVIEVARRANERAARLQEVTAALAATNDAAEVGQAVLSEGVAALGASGGGLLMQSDDERLTVPATVGYAEPLVARLREETPESELPAAYALRTGEAVWLESREDRDALFPALTGLEPGTVSLCAVPLRAGGRVLGALRFSFEVARLFDLDERRFILTLAGQTAQALERAAAFAAAQAANDKLAFVAAASAALAESFDYRTTLRNVTRLAVPRLADWCVVHVTEDGGLVALESAHADPAKDTLVREYLSRYPVDLASARSVAQVIRTGESELYPRVTDEMLAADAEDDQHLAAIRALGLSSVLVVPLAARGRVFGALSMFYADSGRRYGPADLSLAEDLAHRAALAIDNATRFSDRA